VPALKPEDVGEKISEGTIKADETPIGKEKNVLGRERHFIGRGKKGHKK